MPDLTTLLPPRIDPRPEAEKLLRAVVLEVGATLLVSVPSLSDRAVIVEHWEGTPSPGDEVLIGFDEEGDEWVVAGIDSLGDDWIAPTLATGWSDFGSGYEISGYRKAADGTIFLRGLLAKGAAGGTTIFTLPAGYRPSYEVLLTGYMSSGVATRIDIQTDGQVVAFAPAVADGQWWTLGGLNFKP